MPEPREPQQDFELEGPEPTNREIAEACRELLSEEEYQDLLAMADTVELDLFLGDVQILLETKGIDADDFLENKGLMKYFGK